MLGLTLPWVKGAFWMDINNIILWVFLAVFTDGIQCEIFITLFVVFYVDGLEIAMKCALLLHNIGYFQGFS